MEQLWADFTVKAKSAVDSMKNRVELAVEQASDSFVGQSLSVSSKTDKRVRVVRKLAEGGFSSVYECLDEQNESRRYAVKRMVASTAEQLACVERELEVHKKLGGKRPGNGNIIPLLTKRKVDSSWLLLFPLLPTSLQDALLLGKIVDNDTIVSILIQISLALEYLHSKNLCHRDVKPHNVLLTSEFKPYLMDFGSCRTPRNVVIQTKTEYDLEIERASRESSAAFRAPELWQAPMDAVFPCELNGEKMDVFSLGCVAYACFFGRGWSCFEHPTQGLLTLAIKSGKVTFPIGASTFGTQIVESACACRPADRCTMSELVSSLKGDEFEDFSVDF